MVERGGVARRALLGSINPVSLPLVLYPAGITGDGGRFASFVPDRERLAVRVDPFRERISAPSIPAGGIASTGPTGGGRMRFGSVPTGGAIRGALAGPGTTAGPIPGGQ